MATGHLDEARQRLEESTRLRREMGHLPGVAGNLVGLAYIAAARGRRDDALAILDEASTIAEATEARRILDQVSETRRTACHRLPDINTYTPMTAVGRTLARLPASHEQY